MKLYPSYNLFQNTSTEKEIKDYYSSYHSPSRSQRKGSKQQYSINETSSLFSIPENGSIEIDAVCRCNRNEWNGSVTPQLFLEDYQIKRSCAYVF